MIIVLKGDRKDAVSEALSILAAHMPTREPAGQRLCKGCYRLAARVNWWPCEQACWAISVVTQPSRKRG